MSGNKVVRHIAQKAGVSPRCYASRANCKMCNEKFLEFDVYSRVCNIHSGGTDFQENVPLCANCFNELLNSGYELCDFCDDLVPCIGKSEHFLEAWKHSPSGSGLELQNICSWATENGIVEKCPCCSEHTLCTKEILYVPNGQCPDCTGPFMKCHQFLFEEEDLIDDKDIENYIDFYWYEKVLE